MFIGHSKGLGLLFMTEMWERFGFYALQALLVLYMTAQAVEGGLGMTYKDAIMLFHIYFAASYITPIVGGYLSDRFLGQRKSAMIGAVMMAAGYFTMTINDLTMFYLALTMVAVGNGFFKPCLTSILGQLYDDHDESQRDSAYSIFYMGINIGAWLSSIVAGILLVTYGFDAGFAAAGAAMLLGLGIFWWGKDKYLGEVGIKPQVKVKDDHVVPLTSEDWSRLGLVFVLFVITILFIIAWGQMGGLITLFIQDHVDRSVNGWTIPTPWLAQVDPLFIVIFAPIFSAFWAKLGEQGKDPFVGAKMGIGCILVAISYLLLGVASRQVLATEGYMAHWGWIIANKLFVVFGELCVIPISWAAVTRLSPPAYISRVMGMMLAGIGIGYYFAGTFGSMVEDVGAQVIFDGMAIGLVVLAVICIAINPKLKRMACEA